MANALSRRPDFHEDKTSALAFPQSEINAIEFALELNDDIAKSILKHITRIMYFFLLFRK